ncbi:hypothetical protein LZD49_28680 [Dyadobacter sp. CY261]|uniref:glycosyl hydrolase family 28-related protein n=1 Tax=Dyadobacter sp. CY261 TaxID=2907203 RepID=UPI001F258ED2|nr:glycosyl hydrolase family 28-related protein [Dyadobacter sp. CY261]MCF0074495.1 hypothetical protein [Dyadobacter sp. CY261]
MRIYFIFLLLTIFTFLQNKLDASPKIDPIKFSISTSATNVAVNEEFEISIKASYMYIPANTAFVFEGANSFRLKLVLPDGFQQTGGSFSDFAGAELSSTKPYVSYTVKGKFTRDANDGVFQLLRSHQKADNQSTFIQVATLSFKTEDGLPVADDANARIALTGTPGYVPYLSISQVRAGAADTARAVFITDNGKYGLFRYNASSTSPDDGAMTILGGGRRYERVYEGAVNVTWFGAVADGTTDQTAVLQAILYSAKYRNVFFPKGAGSYRIKTLRLLSNTTLNFEEGTVVEGLGTLGTSEKLIYMYDVNNIIIRAHGVTFKDHRENYTSGQYRHIFSLEGVFNASLEGMAANDSGGDGFYIGAGSVRKVSENIRIANVSANNNRRHGLALTTGKNIEISNAVLTNTKGEGPQAGLNMEINSAENRLEGVRVQNVTTGGNTGPGIVVNPGMLSGSDRMIEVYITNHIDDGSQYGLLVNSGKSVLGGSVTIESPTWKNSRLCGFVARNWGYRACAVTLLNPTVINCNTSASTSPTAGAAFYVHREAADVGDTNLGNIHIINPKIMDLRTPMLTQRAFSFKDWASPNNKILNCSIIDPIKVGSFFPGTNMIANAEILLSDRYNSMVHEFATGNSIADYTYYKPLYTNQTSTGTRNLTLGKVNAGFPEITVEVRSPQIVTIYPNATDNIVPLSPVNGKYITSKVVGSKIVLKKTLDNSWFIKEIIGTWTVQP